jgi:hypothetical protein
VRDSVQNFGVQVVPPPLQSSRHVSPLPVHSSRHVAKPFLLFVHFWLHRRGDPEHTFLHVRGVVLQS